MRYGYLILMAAVAGLIFALAGCGTGVPINPTTPAVPLAASTQALGNLIALPAKAASNYTKAHTHRIVYKSNLPGPEGFVPADIRHIYGFDQIPGTGTGQTIAIVDFSGSPTIVNDLEFFDQQLNLPAPPSFQIVYPTGVPAVIDPGFAGETTLDVEWAHAIAPGANILLVIVGSNGSTQQSQNELLECIDFAAQNASVVSMSFGNAEFATEADSDFHFNHPGVSFFVSSGDDGSGVEWPSICPFVTAVGGTSLNGLQGSVTETAWVGSSGGLSQFEARPDYQSSVVASTQRAVPDVAYDADPLTGVTVFQSGQGFSEIGGTSAGAPQWAGLMALVNSARAQNGKAPLANLNSVLYSLGSPSAFFNDVTQGTNPPDTTNPSPQPAGNTGRGYDEVTGLGSPAAAQSIPALVGRP